MTDHLLNRRQALKQAAATLGVFAGSSIFGKAFASACRITPAQTEGPFYPLPEQQDQPDKNRDLTTVKGRSERALGQVIYVAGLVTDDECQPVAKALVEIWQACASGKYNHPGDDNTAPLDPNFQYWGRALTDARGRYLFKTILPGAYPAARNWIRPPHIHFKVAKAGFHELTTQMYFAGNKYNKTDRILLAVPAAQRGSVVIALEPPSAHMEPTAKRCRFDLTLRRA